jgi:hypothetical protein
VDSAETAEGLYGGFLRLSGDPGLSEASHRVDVRVVAPGLPDLTPLSSTGGVTIVPSPAGASEDFDVDARVDNIGLADAGPFTVNFFAGDDLLGTSDVPGGLAALSSTVVPLQVAGGTLVEGFHVIRVEVAPPAGGESDETNNSATTVHEVGAPGPSSDAVIIVSPGSSASAECGGTSIQGNGRADYLLTSGSSLLAFPVKGGLTTISLLDSTATNVIATFAPTHTLTNGTFQQSIESPAPGDYVVRIEVTDFTLTGVSDIPLHVDSEPTDCSCDGDCSSGSGGGSGGGIPPGGSGYAPGWDFSVCGGDLTLLDETCTTPISGDLAAGSGVCVQGTVHYSGAFTVLNQPASFVAHIQQGGGFREELIDIQLVNFFGSANGGSGFIDLQTVWFPPDDGEHVIEFRIDPTVSCWNTAKGRACESLNNNAATIGLRVGTGEPGTGVVVSASVGGCRGPFGASGSAHYANSSLPVGCGFVMAELFDAADPSVPISNASGARTNSFGGYGIGGTTGTSTPGEFIIRATVSDGTLTGTTEGDYSCEPPPPPPEPDSLRCGDDVVNDSKEECDGSDDSACLGQECRTDCTCLPPPCGDNMLNAPGEQCDGSDDLACPGECQADCTCPPLPEPFDFGDLYVFSDDIAFVGSCDPLTGEPLTGLFGIPEPGDMLGVFATISYVGPTPLTDPQQVDVTEILPVGDALEQFPIGSITVNFPEGEGEDSLCLPWTPDTNGTRIVQVAVDPTVEQSTLNDAATRAFRVGSDVCQLELSANTIQPATGFPVSLEVTGTDTSDLTNVLDLTVLPMPMQTIPPGMTTSFDPSPPLATPFTTTLTVGIDDTTPEGSYSLAVVGSSDACTAIDVFTVSVSVTEACDGVICPVGPCGTSTCDPGTGACVLDALPATTVCRDSAGPCDVAESCTGFSVVCPDDGFEAATTECRGSAGICDVAESCSGNGALCPDDGFKSATTVCRVGSSDLCDPDEACTGNSAACPADFVESTTTVCNPGSGDLCDPDELCTGVAGAACPAGATQLAAAGTVCNSGSGDPNGSGFICDPDEVCSGVEDQACPADSFANAMTVCNAGSGDPNGSGFICDPEELCTGVADVACAADSFANATTVCNAGSGDPNLSGFICDPDELCTGNPDVACPADSFESDTTVCRSDAGVCDVGDFCAGIPDESCGPDVKEACALVTDSGLCPFDINPDKGLCLDLAGFPSTDPPTACDLSDGDPGCSAGTCAPSSEFRLAFTPSPRDVWPAYKLNTSNPGQYFYNLIVDGAPGEEVAVDIDIPYPFETQGATPGHVYDAHGVVFDPDGCFIPLETLHSFGQTIGIEDYIAGTIPAGGSTLACDAVECGLDGVGTCSFSVDVVIPDSGQAYVNLHLNYGLKGVHVDANDGTDVNPGATICDLASDRYDLGVEDLDFGGWDALQNDTADVALSNCKSYGFSHACAACVDTSLFGDQVLSLNVFKNIKGVYGLVQRSNSGAGIGGTAVQLTNISTQQVVWAGTTDAEGYYKVDHHFTGQRELYVVSLPTENMEQLIAPKGGAGWAEVSFDLDTRTVHAEWNTVGASKKKRH